MQVLITGGTGFVGSALCQRWQQRGAAITVLSRNPDRARRQLGEGVTVVAELDALPASAGFDVVVNLAGAPIADRPWTASRKRLLRDSRIALTESLIGYLEGCERRPELLISASAIGYYGNQGDHFVDENSEPLADYASVDFAHQLCRDWEAAAFKGEALGMRVCVLRLGLVVGPGGGIVQRMSLPFKLGLGGPLGDGRQWMSWVHRADVLAMIDYLLAHATLRGVFNATAPQPVTNQEFSRQLAAQYQRPCWLRVPAGVLRLGLGEMSGLLLEGQRVLPTNLREAGYEFKYTDLSAALSDACQ